MEIESLLYTHGILPLQARLLRDSCIAVLWSVPLSLLRASPLGSERQAHQEVSHSVRSSSGWARLTLCRYVGFAMHRMRMAKHSGVTPYLVFGGDVLSNPNPRYLARSAASNWHLLPL